MVVNRDVEKFILLNLVILFIVQPGSIILANFDAPYGFMRDLTTWLSSYVGLSPVALIYLVKKRESIRKEAIPVYIIFILVLAYVIYTVQQPLFEGFRSPDYKPNFFVFLAVYVLSAFISIMLLPVAIVHLDEVYLGYGYDLPLGLANLVIFVLITVLYVHLRRSR
ncbi:MAG: hypothetical protein OIN66_10105 [Candidatus Methanoperedens sp.]|nr:hypothetical protein [Candidatus Methanoperedens sp.]